MVAEIKSINNLEELALESFFSEHIRPLIDKSSQFLELFQKVPEQAAIYTSLVEIIDRSIDIFLQLKEENSSIEFEFHELFKKLETFEGRITTLQIKDS